MSDRDIKSHLEKIYNVEVSPDLISRVTNEVIEEVREWQNRPLLKTSENAPYIVQLKRAVLLKNQLKEAILF
jgi:hypothetical protein